MQTDLQADVDALREVLRICGAWDETRDTKLKPLIDLVRVDHPTDKLLIFTQPIAFFCSQSCPGDVILKAQDWANARTEGDVPVISGFHTPVERDVLRILLRGARPIIYTLARAIEGARLPAALRAAETEGHALILSPFNAATRQTTARSAEERNRHILTRAASVLIAHASPGGKTESLAAEAIGMGLPVCTLPSPSNANLIGMGATVI